MSYRLVKRESLTLSKKLHKQLLAAARVPGERDLDKPRLNFIRGLLKNDLYNRCDWAVCKCKENGKLYRVNGQHTMTVLSEVLDGTLADVKFPEGVPVDYQTWECDLVKDLGKVFDNFDHHRSTRKPKDRLGVYMAEHEDVAGKVTKDLVGNLLAGIAWGVRTITEIEEEIPVELIPTEAYERGNLLNVVSVRNFVNAMSDLQGGPFKEWIGRAGVIAGLYKEYLKGVSLDSLDDFNLVVEQMLCEVGEEAQGFARKVRQECTRKGKPPEHFYKITSAYFKTASQLVREADTEEKERLKTLIREVRDEAEKEGEPVAAGVEDEDA